MALDATGAKIGSTAYLDVSAGTGHRFSAKGLVSFHSATIDGAIVATGADLQADPIADPIEDPEEKGNGHREGDQDEGGNAIRHPACRVGPRGPFATFAIKIGHIASAARRNATAWEET